MTHLHADIWRQSSIHVALTQLIVQQVVSAYIFSLLIDSHTGAKEKKKASETFHNHKSVFSIISPRWPFRESSLLLLAWNVHDMAGRRTATQAKLFFGWIFIIFYSFLLCYLFCFICYCADADMRMFNVMFCGTFFPHFSFSLSLFSVLGEADNFAQAQ